MIDTKLSARDSLAIDCIKAFAILSVIAAHTVVLNETNAISYLVTSLWSMFSKVGVIVFFIVGGFLYSRKDGDNKEYWTKKFFRIVLPWLICSFITYVVSVIGGNDCSVYEYISWIFGSGTWYYYVVIYLLFLLIFKLFYRRDVILWVLVSLQVFALALNTFGISTTLKTEFFTDYLNPLFWVGYFALGILVRRYRLDIKLRDSKLIFVLAIVLIICMTPVMYLARIHTYFSLITMIYCLAFAVVLWKISYIIANTRFASFTRMIGVSTYCIYLLHMQIVQTAIGLLPECVTVFVFAPFIGLAIMILLVCIANWVCRKISFGDKLKMCFGL